MKISREYWYFWKFCFFFLDRKSHFWVENATLGQNAIFRSKSCDYKVPKMPFWTQKLVDSNSNMVIFGIFLRNWLRTVLFLVFFGSFSGQFGVILIILEVIFALKVENLTIFEKILEMDSSTLNINFSVVC